MFQPVVKWSGSKRSQSKEIVSYFPKEIDTYYEPFCGGCSVLRALIETSYIKVNHYVCSDINVGLINLWKAIKDSPEGLIKDYTSYWKELNQDGNIERRKNYFNEIRKEYNDSTCNEESDSSKFLFLLRTCVNGMPRYNKDGKFNTSLHLNRPGINPSTLEKILFEWSELLNKNDVTFYSVYYDTFKDNSKNDFFYLDPPYFNTKGMYYGKIDYDYFFNWLRSLNCGYALSFDGMIRDKSDYTVDLNEDLYDMHRYLHSGNSSFRRLKSDDKDNVVYESLYLKYVNETINWK